MAIDQPKKINFEINLSLLANAFLVIVGCSVFSCSLQTEAQKQQYALENLLIPGNADECRKWYSAESNVVMEFCKDKKFNSYHYVDNNEIKDEPDDIIGYQNIGKLMLIHCILFTQKIRFPVH